MPAEAVVVKPCPEEADSERTGGKGRGEDAAAHRGAGGVVIVEGAEADSRITHAWGGFREGEEEDLVEKCQRKERNRCGDGGDLRGDAGRAAGAPASLPTVMAKTAVKARKAEPMMQPSTMLAMRRRLKDAV